MPERRSGVDLVACSEGWAVVYCGKRLSVHVDREAAVVAARVESKRVMNGRIVFGQTRPLSRLLKDRRHVLSHGDAHRE